jgi:hypothetical protein
VEKIVRVKLLPQHLNDIGDLFPRPQHDAPPSPDKNRSGS